MGLVRSIAALFSRFSNSPSPSTEEPVGSPKSVGPSSPVGSASSANPETNPLPDADERTARNLEERPALPNAAHALGRLGEEVAAKHLKRSRYKVLYRNFRAPGGGEVDIVCRDRDTNELVFAEVKTRQSRDFADPAANVTRAKQELIARGAAAWLRMLDRDDIRYRFDIVEVIITPEHREVVIIKNAFRMPERYRAP